MTSPGTWRAALALGVLLPGCTPVSQSYIVRSQELSCDEANRYVYSAVTDMNMKVTSFTRAEQGRTGRLRAVGADRAGDVTIMCKEDGVEIDPDQSTMGDRIFERGVFLSVTGRSGLQMDRGQVTGRMEPARTQAEAAEQGTPPPSGMVLVELQPQRGFEAVLDFDADVAAAGVLPLRVTIRNGSTRTYDFRVDGVEVRGRESGQVATRLAAPEARSRLVAKAGSEGAQTPIGNVASAGRILVEQEIKSARLAPGASVSGYLYYPTGRYDRAKIRMRDVGADEIESFLVDF